MKRFFHKIKKFFIKIFIDQITLYSAQASFYIIISSLPFIMLLVSLAGFITPISKEEMLKYASIFLPGTVMPTIRILADEIFEKSIHMISLSAITMLWTASRGMASLERGIKRVYRTRKRSNVIADYAMSVLYTVVFIVMLLLNLILQVFGNVLIDFASKLIVLTKTEILWIKGVAFFVVLSAIFLLMYYIFSNREMKLKYHIPGALISTAGWMLFSHLFSIYIDNFSNYSYIYGSIAALILMMLWLYFCVIILLCGAEINGYIYRYYIKEKRKNLKGAKK